MNANQIEKIRIETALSAWPIHRLSHRDEMPIRIRHGELTWEVTFNKKHGQPGPLAYRLDALIINRKIDEAGQPTPETIRLGSLREIAEQLDLGTNTARVRQALHQNASAYIEAKIKYTARDRTVHEEEIGMTRYAVTFRGKTMPDGQKADAVYITLNPKYRKILDSAARKPMDYTYLRSLPHSAMRCYELVSGMIWYVLKQGQTYLRCKYSFLCERLPLVRQRALKEVRKKLASVIDPHLRSGYFRRVWFERRSDLDGTPDWDICIEPGPKARVDFATFEQGRIGWVTQMLLPACGNETVSASATTPAPTGLAKELADIGVTDGVAVELVRAHPEERIRRQMAALAWMIERRPSRVKEPAAYLRRAIESDYKLPKDFTSTPPPAIPCPPAVKAEEPVDPVQALLRDVDADSVRKAEFNAAAIAHAGPVDRADYEKLTRPFDRTLHEAKLREAYARHLLAQRQA